MKQSRSFRLAPNYMLKQLILSLFLLILLTTYAEASKIPKIEDGILGKYSIQEQGSVKIPVVVEYVNGSISRKSISVQEILQLASNPNVVYIRKPRIAQPLYADSSMVDFSDFHESGITGEGVKIAVIDLGFKEYKDFLNLDRVVEVKSFRSDGRMDYTIHGTLCANIINSIAPDAELYLLAVESDVDFVDAVEYAILKDVDIISISIGWIAGPFDGSGYLCQAVNKARQAGILVVVSAGNFADKHYEGMFSDPDKDGWHNFNGVDEILNLGELKKGEKLELALSWDDWPRSANDYDLYLLYRTPYGWEMYTSSESPQTGYEEPVEVISETIPFDGTWGVAIRKNEGAKPLHIELYSNVKLSEYVVPNSSLSTPADADGAISVGAFNPSEMKIYDFSSRGPTNDGRTKPDLVSIGSVSINGYNFMGTSVSTPHIAALAALIKSMHPDFSVGEIVHILQSFSIDMGEEGKDNVYGYGIPNASKIYCNLKNDRVGISIIAPKVVGSEFVAYVSLNGTSSSNVKSFFYNLTYDPSCVVVDVEPVMNFDIHLKKQGEGYLTFIAASREGIVIHNTSTIVTKLVINATCSDSVYLAITDAEHDGVHFNYLDARGVNIDGNFDIRNGTYFMEAFDLNRNGFIDNNELKLVEGYLLVDGTVDDSELVAMIFHWVNDLLSNESLLDIIMLWLNSS